jgi:L-amino acid N-acyltransferase YncA
MTVTLRDATLADALAILPIYNHAVNHTTAMWSEEESTLAEREAWIAARQGAGLPVIVAEIEGAVVGFGSFGEFRARSGYRLTVEHSVYVDHNRHRGGIGRALLSDLIDRARAMGLHAMIGGIEAGNAPSIALHQALGFVEVGRLPQVGVKFGRWLDLAFLQLTLDDRAAP